MLEVFELAENHQPTEMSVVLTYDERKKSRHRVTSECGKDIGWFLERGQVLKDGDVLKASTGETIKVIAAQESVSEAQSQDTLLLMRGAYHLGNRHVPLQIEKTVLRFQHDHVLDDMLRGLGIDVAHKRAPFHPESGAYHGSGSGHSHSHSHSHSHGNSHSHSHGDSHSHSDSHHH